MNPYEKKVWDYNIAIAKEAALAGFKEIQFDYVRFPEGAESLGAQAVFGGRNDVLKDEIIKAYKSSGIEVKSFYQKRLFKLKTI